MGEKVMIVGGIAGKYHKVVTVHISSFMGIWEAQNDVPVQKATI